MKKGIYITTARIGTGSGGGIVTLNEAQALNRLAELKTMSINIPIREYNIPFMNDYISAYTLLDELNMGIHYDIAHFYGSPFGITASILKKDKTLISATIAPHNLELSVEEHIKIFGSYPYIHMIDPILSEVYMKHFKIADLIITPSRMGADYIKKKLNLKCPIKVIPHGVYLPDSKTIKPYPEIFTVANVSQYGPDKGQKYLLDAWNDLKLKDARLIIAGINTDKIGGLGYVKDVSEVYNSSTIYVQPSVTEGWGIGILEAMSYGRPVIVTNGAGSHEAITDGEDGFIVPIRDPMAIADRIKYFYDNPSEVHRMGMNARNTAERYTWDKIQKKYEGVFRECLSGNG